MARLKTQSLKEKGPPSGGLPRNTCPLILARHHVLYLGGLSDIHRPSYICSSGTGRLQLPREVESHSALRLKSRLVKSEMSLLTAARRTGTASIGLIRRARGMDDRTRNEGSGLLRTPLDRFQDYKCRMGDHIGAPASHDARIRRMEKVREGCSQIIGTGLLSVNSEPFDTIRVRRPSRIHLKSIKSVCCAVWMREDVPSCRRILALLVT